MAKVTVGGVQVGAIPQMREFFDYIYPVGVIYETTNPALSTVAQMNAHYVGTTWDVFGPGRVLVGVGETRYPDETVAVPRTNYNTVGQPGAAPGFVGAGGYEGVILTNNQTPPHTHTTHIGTFGIDLNGSSLVSGVFTLTTPGIPNASASGAGQGAQVTMTANHDTVGGGYTTRTSNRTSSYTGISEWPKRKSAWQQRL